MTRKLTDQTIKVTDQSHDYSLLLRYDADAHYRGLDSSYWFDIVDNTEVGL